MSGLIKNDCIICVPHYSGIGTEIRENFVGGSPETKVVVNMPEGLGRYGIEDAAIPYSNINSFEWYLKNNLGSTMLVYGLKVASNSEESNVLSMKAAYDYRSFGEQVTLKKSADKVTETFTGKELDDEIALDYFGARYLDPMLGLWISVDPKREYYNLYNYLRGNPINLIDPTGMAEAAPEIKDISLDSYNYINDFEPTQDELNTFVKTYDRFEGLTTEKLSGILEKVYVQFGGEPQSEGMNGFYNPGDINTINMTTRALDDSHPDWDMRIRSTIFHETAHYLNYLYGKTYGEKPYPNEVYPKSGFNKGSVELGKQFEYDAYGKDY